MVKIKPHHVHLICNAKYHDTDFARSELVNLFSEHDDLGVSISQDYSDFYKFNDSDLLITYTCDLSPAQEEVDTRWKMVRVAWDKCSHRICWRDANSRWSRDSWKN